LYFGLDFHMYFGL
jgi:hypothetical protein